MITLIPEALGEEFARYKELRQSNFGKPTPDSRYGLSQEKTKLEKDLDELGASLAAAQHSLGEQRAELARWQEAEARMKADAGWGTARKNATLEAEREFDEIAAITGVQDIQIVKEGLSVVVFARILYKDVVYDIEDWRLKIWPGQTNSVHYSTVGVMADCLRLSKAPNDDYFSFPRFRYGDTSPLERYHFCFGEHWPMMSKAVDAHDYVSAVRIAVAAMHYSQVERRERIPNSFGKAPHGLVQNLADQVAAGDRALRAHYDKCQKAYVKFRLAHIGDDIVRNVSTAEHEVDRLERNLAELGREIATAETRLGEVEAALEFLGEDDTDYATEFMLLLGMRGVSGISVVNKGITLIIQRTINADGVDYDLGTYTLYLGPGFSGRQYRSSVQFDGNVDDAHEPPLRLFIRDNKYRFDFYDAIYDIDEACKNGDLLSAADYAIGELFNLKPAHLRRLKKLFPKGV